MLVSMLQVRDLHLVGAASHWCRSWQLQPVVGIGLLDHPILPLAVPLAGAEVSDVLS
jgi:hypothetical protein